MNIMHAIVWLLTWLLHLDWDTGIEIASLSSSVESPNSTGSQQQ